MLDQRRRMVRPRKIDDKPATVVPTGCGAVPAGFVEHLDKARLLPALSAADPALGTDLGGEARRGGARAGGLGRRRRPAERSAGPAARPRPSLDGLRINPLTNMHFFVLGMVSCLAWRRLACRRPVGMAVGTLLELGAFLLVGWSPYTTVTDRTIVVGTAIAPWVPAVRASSLMFALLIVAMAMSSGLVSRLLSRAPFVRLGEISYALYLVHYGVLLMLAWRLPAMLSAPEPVCAVAHWAISLALAWTLWRCVEVPAREYLRTTSRLHEGRLPDRQWRVVEAGLLALLFVILAIDWAAMR